MHISSSAVSIMQLFYNKRFFEVALEFNAALGGDGSEMELAWIIQGDRPACDDVS